MSTVTLAELDATTVELLPKRETLSWRTRNKVNVSFVWAANSSMAVNEGSIFANAQSSAGQSIVVNQG